MIDYKQHKFRDISGEYNAVVTEVKAIENEWYDPEKDNSTPFTLNISFDLEDETYGLISHEQRFVAPIVGNKGLFQQLFDVLGELPDADGGAFDEQKFVGLRVRLNMGKRVAKDGREYPTVDWVMPLQQGTVSVVGGDGGKETPEESPQGFIESLG